MATQPVDPDSVHEQCERCAATTPHDVHVEIRTENAGSENARFSREPYRVLTCRDCGSESAMRMNNA